MSTKKLKVIKLEKAFVDRFEKLVAMARQVSDLKKDLLLERDILWRDVERKHGKTSWHYDDETGTIHEKDKKDECEHDHLEVKGGVIKMDSSQMENLRELLEKLAK